MRRWLVGITCLSLLGAAWEPKIPRTWDDESLHGLELPIVGLDAPVTHISPDYYYSIPEAPIPKSYPVYAPEHEPAGYMEWLKQQEPAEAVDFSELQTKEDWIKAGRYIFDGPFSPLSARNRPTAEQWREYSGTDLYLRPAKDGTYPWVRYWVVEKGDVRGFFTECGSCHTRVLDDGRVVPGAQGNLNESFDHAMRLQSGRRSLERWKRGKTWEYSVPWLDPDPAQLYEGLTLSEAIAMEQTIPPGVRFRVGTNHLFPAKIPDLIGVADRKYLDATGLVRHRSIGDLMRYATLVNVAEGLTQFGDFKPQGELPDPKSLGRYSDEALYALALYIYSLEPPPNPNKPTALSGRGEGVFDREGCALCHTPPLYTNNALIPAEAFEVPDGHDESDEILHVSVGTDTRLALQSRKGTGYYRVPSLKGVWYRGPFEHNGSVAALEDWFDPARLKDDYVPTAFVGYGFETRAVKGHQFGLALSPEDRTALIAFLKTL